MNCFFNHFQRIHRHSYIFFATFSPVKIFGEFRGEFLCAIISGEFFSISGEKDMRLSAVNSFFIAFTPFNAKSYNSD